jgi:hypothetical protein
MISKKEKQVLVEFLNDLNRRGMGLEGVSDQEEVLRVMARAILLLLDRDRRIHSHEDQN